MRADGAGDSPTMPGPTRFASPSPAIEEAVLGIYYVAERDHHPFEQGPLVYSLSGHALLEPPARAALARQAEAYAESYLRRRKEL